MVPCYGWYLGCPLSCVHYFAFEGDKVPLNFRDWVGIAPPDHDSPVQVNCQTIVIRVVLLIALSLKAPKYMVSGSEQESATLSAA
jgi:hypothetical protein